MTQNNSKISMKMSTKEERLLEKIIEKLKRKKTKLESICIDNVSIYHEVLGHDKE